MYKFKYISIGIISTVPLYYLWNPVNRFINRTSNNFDKDYDDIQNTLKILIKKNMSWGDVYTYFI